MKQALNATNGNFLFLYLLCFFHYRPSIHLASVNKTWSRPSTLRMAQNTHRIWGEIFCLFILFISFSRPWIHSTSARSWSRPSTLQMAQNLHQICCEMFYLYIYFVCTIGLESTRRWQDHEAGPQRHDGQQHRQQEQHRETRDDRWKDHKILRSTGDGRRRTGNRIVLFMRCHGDRVLPVVTRIVIFHQLYRGMGYLSCW